MTNLGVHFKLGRENALAWVTTLDKGAPVAGATVRVSDCLGTQLAQGVTDAQGIARFTGLSSDRHVVAKGAMTATRILSVHAAARTAAKTWPSPGATGKKA